VVLHCCECWLLVAVVVALQGVELSRDVAGNVYLTRRSKCVVTVRGIHDHNYDACLATDILRSNGIVSNEKTKVKLF